MLGLRSFIKFFAPFVVLVGLVFFCTISLNQGLVSLNIKRDPGFHHFISANGTFTGPIEEMFDAMPLEGVKSSHILFGYSSQDGFIFLEKL